MYVSVYHATILRVRSYIRRLDMEGPRGKEQMTIDEECDEDADSVIEIGITDVVLQCASDAGGGISHGTVPRSNKVWPRRRWTDRKHMATKPESDA